MFLGKVDQLILASQYLMRENYYQQIDKQTNKQQTNKLSC